MSTIEDMADFVQLWDLVSNFSLTDQSDDIITWRWIVDGEYSDHVSSTIQLSGSFSFSTHPRFGKHKKKKVHVQEKQKFLRQLGCLFSVKS